MRRIVGWIALLSGGLLLGMALVGHYTMLGDYAGAEAREWEVFDTALASELRSWSELTAEADQRVRQAAGRR